MADVFYRRDLSHFHPSDGIFFITFRLAGTMPQQILKRLYAEKELLKRSFVD
jgi:putative transposase